MTSSRDQLTKPEGIRRICPWCVPHFFAKQEGRKGDHTRCDDASCGCHCQNLVRWN